MNVSDVAAIFGIFFGIFGTGIGIAGTVVAFKSSKRNKEKEIQTEAKEDGELKFDIAYIKKRSDDTLLEVKETNRNLNELSDRVTRVEEVAKSAHKRIDELKEGKWHE